VAQADLRRKVPLAQKRVRNSQEMQIDIRMARARVQCLIYTVLDQTQILQLQIRTRLMVGLMFPNGRKQRRRGGGQEATPHPSRKNANNRMHQTVMMYRLVRCQWPSRQNMWSAERMQIHQCMAPLSLRLILPPKRVRLLCGHFPLDSKTQNSKFRHCLDFLFLLQYNTLLRSLFHFL
jgi:hypothetical protein